MVPATAWTGIRPWLTLACRLVLGAVFVIAGSTKVTDLAGSGRAVNAYQLMPYSTAKIVGAALPFVEIAVGLLLILGVATRLSAIVAAAMLLVYIGGITSVWIRGLAIDCGCFSKGGALTAGQRPSYGADILRDVGLLAIAAFIIWFPISRFSVDQYVIGPDPEYAGADAGAEKWAEPRR